MFKSYTKSEKSAGFKRLDVSEMSVPQIWYNPKFEGPGPIIYFGVWLAYVGLQPHLTMLQGGLGTETVREFKRML